MPRYYYVKQEPPTAIKAISAHTHGTQNTELEHPFGLPAGILSENVFIRNDDITAISISLDGKASYFTVGVGQSVSIDVACATLWSKCATAVSQAFTILVGGEF